MIYATWVGNVYSNMVNRNLAGWLVLVEVCARFWVNVFWWIVGIGGMDCARSCLDSKDRFMDK